MKKRIGCQEIKSPGYGGDREYLLTIFGRQAGKIHNLEERLGTFSIIHMTCFHK
jgi:hypothetical protein